MSLVLTSAPATEPVTLAEAKLWLRVDHTDDDNLITELIKAVRRTAENKLDRALITQTWKLELDDFPDGRGREFWYEGDAFLVPKPPLISVTSLKYIDTAGTQQTIAAADYRVDTSSEPGRITPDYGDTWPTARDVTNAVELIFVAGYGAASAVPEGIKVWMKSVLAAAYDNREMVVTGTIVANLEFLDGLLDPFLWGAYA